MREDLKLSDTIKAAAAPDSGSAKTQTRAAGTSGASGDESAARTRQLIGQFQTSWARPFWSEAPAALARVRSEGRRAGSLGVLGFALRRPP